MTIAEQSRVALKKSPWDQMLLWLRINSIRVRIGKSNDLS